MPPNQCAPSIGHFNWKPRSEPSPSISRSGAEWRSGGPRRANDAAPEAGGREETNLWYGIADITEQIQSCLNDMTSQRVPFLQAYGRLDIVRMVDLARPYAAKLLLDNLGSALYGADTDHRLRDAIDELAIIDPNDEEHRGAALANSFSSGHGAGGARGSPWCYRGMISMSNRVSPSTDTNIPPNQPRGVGFRSVQSGRGRE